MRLFANTVGLLPHFHLSAPACTNSHARRICFPVVAIFPMAIRIEYRPFNFVWERNASPVAFTCVIMFVLICSSIASSEIPFG